MSLNGNGCLWKWQKVLNDKFFLNISWKNDTIIIEGYEYILIKSKKETLIMPNEIQLDALIDKDADILIQNVNAKIKPIFEKKNFK